MARDSFLLGLLMFGCSIHALIATSDVDQLDYMSKEEREALKEEARDMFYHAYNAYMDNAYPADELMPLSCKGRYRGSEPNRGDIDSTLGNFSLTLVDTLDTLVVLGDLEEFENAVKLVARDVSFETDVIVSLFETNIRMLGGLLSGHILAEYLQQRADIMPWYRGQLLDLAKDLGYRFLPAFNTSTGIPYGRVNLKYGMKGVPTEVSRETCTACAGSMILEMAALSRLTGESIFEEKAQKAMDVLWRMRHRRTDLMGSVLNVNSGDWVRRDSGVGAGIDSYYEYCLKAYILLGDEKYLGRFNKHYQAVMKYVSQGPMLLDVHMHRPNTNSKNFMDALLAFWPGLQVLKGDIKPAVETHEMLYQVMQRHNFIPEAFTTDFQVHWGHHPLRPEFLESTYFLYRATGDHYYLGVGRKVLKSLQTYARVPCGYAAVSDVRTNKHDDTMDSFVLSETLKYLFLLFVEPADLVLDLDEFIFTTEGHLLPLTLASIRTNISSDFERETVQVDEFDRTCPNSLHLFPASVRQPLRNMVEDVCPRRPIKRRLSASQFQANNLEHLKILSEMGITTLTLPDGRVQLLHTFSNAKTPQDSEEGLLFMQEMVELSIMQSQQTETKSQAVTFVKPKTYPPQKVTLLAGPAHFGPELHNFNKVTGKVVFTYPLAACTDLLNADKLMNKIVIMNRGDCMFIEKARRIQKAGAIAGIVLDNVAGTSAATSPIFAMSGDEKEVDDVRIPVVFLFSVEAAELIKAISAGGGDLIVTIGNFLSKDEVQLKAPTDLSMFEQLQGSLKSIFAWQIMPQQTTVNNDLHGDIIISNTEDEQQDTIDFHHLSAQVIEDPFGGEVKIVAKSNVPPVYMEKNLEATTLLEKWQQLKQTYVNQIYGVSGQKPGLHIRTLLLTNYYNWIMMEQGVDINVFSTASLKQKILWLLKELSQVAPNPTMGQVTDLHLMEYGLSILENLESSLKSIFARQITSQITPSNDLHEDIIIPHTEGEQQDTFDYDHLSVQIINDPLGGEVRITAKSNVPPIYKEKHSEARTLLEKQWRQLRQIFANQIYVASGQKPGLHIRTFLLTSYFNWILIEQGITNINIINTASLNQKLLWLLVELSQVAPNPMIGPLMDSTKQKLFKHHLLTKMDIAVLNLKEIATSLKEIKLTAAGLRSLIKISRFYARENHEYILLRHLFQEVFDGEDKIIKQHLGLLDNFRKIMHNAYKEILVDGWQKNFEKSGENVDSESLKAQLHRSLREHVTRLQDADFTNDNKESNEINPKDPYNRILDETKNYDRKYENFETYILTEIEKVSKKTEQKNAHLHEDVSNVANHVEVKNDESKVVDTDQVSSKYDSLKQNKNETTKHKFENEEEKELISLDIKEEENVNTVNKASKDTKSSTDVVYAETLSNDGNSLSSISKDTMQAYIDILQQIREAADKDNNNNNRNKLSNEQIVKRNSNNNVISEDLLEEFKKPIWASDEEKSKFVTEFQQKTKSSNTKNNIKEDDSKYIEDFTVKLKSRKNNENKYKVKHIDDEL